MMNLENLLGNFTHLFFVHITVDASQTFIHLITFLWVWNLNWDIRQHRQCCIRYLYCYLYNYYYYYFYTHWARENKPSSTCYSKNIMKAWIPLHIIWKICNKGKSCSNSPSTKSPNVTCVFSPSRKALATLWRKNVPKSRPFFDSSFGHSSHSFRNRRYLVADMFYV